RSDFYGKVIALPFVNLATPWCDRVGARLGAEARRLLDARLNWAHMAAWASLVVFFWRPDVKRATFEPAEHARAETSLIERDGAGAITCASNRIFCETFTFGREIGAWTARR